MELTLTVNGRPSRLDAVPGTSLLHVLRESLQLRGILLICPHRENRTRPSANNGRTMRRYKRRYKVERSISWLHNFRRLITRWEYYPELFQSFVHLACLLTILKGF